MGVKSALGLLLLLTLPTPGCATSRGGAGGDGVKSPMLCAQPPQRSFAILYHASLEHVPAGAKRLDLWIPVPSSDAQQSVDKVVVDSPLPHEWQTDSEYGNQVLHVWSDDPERADVMIRFFCTRHAEVAFPPGSARDVSTGPAPTPRLLQPDRLGIIDDRVRRLAAEITAGKEGTLARARAIYDYVIAHMAYDKTTPGWGAGDTARACAIGKGNCTDFHALFISLARASGIPARFGIGLQIPPGEKQGSIGGYHCWAEFWLAGTGWVPVDASEAWKNPDRRDYYFGALDEDRVRLSIGRDIYLAGMRGPPLNYGLWPYAEADGQAVSVGHSVFFSAVEHLEGPAKRGLADATGGGSQLPLFPLSR